MIRDYERAIIVETLDLVGGSHTEAAKLLMLNRTTLESRMKALAIPLTGRRRSK